MGQAEQSVQHVCGLAELKQVRDWEKRPTEFKPDYKTLLPEARTAVKGQMEKPVQKYTCLSKPIASHTIS